MIYLPSESVDVTDASDINNNLVVSTKPEEYGKIWKIMYKLFLCQKNILLYNLLRLRTQYEFCFII